MVGSKVERPSKQRGTSKNKSTQVYKNVSLRKPVRCVPYKRLLMIQRRLQGILNEGNSREEKNKDLSDSLRAEKLLSASLKKESFHWQRLYHESAITINTYKVKQFEMAQVLSACLREIDSIYPNMVAFSESVTSNKIRISNLLTSLPSTDYSCFTKQFQGSGGVNDEYKKRENPMKHKVGPMVKGLHIVTKPKILIERLMLPQTQNRDQVHADDMSRMEVNNQLTPIPEENDHEEENCLRHVSMRPKRSKLGTSWKMRRQEKLKKDQERETVSYNGDSSDSEDLPISIGHMKPVVRCKDVSCLIRNSSLLKVDSGRGGGVDDRHFPVRPDDDPLEGSSWMFNNGFRPSHNESRSSLYKSDPPSDDEDAVVVPQKPSNLSSLNTLVIVNETLNHSKTNKKITKSGNSSHNNSSDFPAEEPDSTNNVETLINNNLSSSKDSLENNVINSSSTSTISPDISTDYRSSNNTCEQQLANGTNRLSIRLSKVPDNTLSSRNNSYDLSRNRHSSFCDSPVLNSSDEMGKRVRKPANHRYPSEEYIIPISKIKQSKVARLSNGKKSGLSTGKKSLTEKKTTKSEKGLKKRLSSLTASNTAANSGGVDKEATKSDSANGSNMRNSSTSKKSSLKKSIRTPKVSLQCETVPSQGNEDLSRPRRNKSNVCYKQSPINVKKRRP